MAVRIELTGPAETLMATLYARAVDARSAHPVLGDRAAVEVLEKIDYDFGRLGIRDATAIGVALRARFLDRWTREFLTVHPGATVLHLGCGLDSRVERIDPGPGVRWYDVDLPEVVELRERLYEQRPGHRAIGASVTDPGWLAEVPGDLPVLVVAEGLTMYLPTAEGPPLLRRLVGHFPRGQLAFDTYSRLAVRLTRRMPVLRRTGSRLDWGIDDPADLEREVPGLRLLSAVPAYDTADPDDHLPRSLRIQIAVLGRTPVLGRVGHIARYAFGRP